MAKQRTLQQLREAFIGAEGLGAAAVMVRVPQALALLDAVKVLQSIHLRAGMTQLADCCVENTCTPHMVDGEKESGCTWQAGVARGFSECAGLAADALDELKKAGVTI